ncbi:hypothetical protein K7X08_002751 [Anisodus acutangulus]|uniref:Uncharacterized protein n=1 Tax=Anisodus acutangulus TaxID=402998 RepID=A0A9Q1MCI5_9SOLA|nr:hypothetical protein K7X08_002751 [Anisodus acutangulus]
MVKENNIGTVKVIVGCANHIDIGRLKLSEAQFPDFIESRRPSPLDKVNFEEFSVLLSNSSPLCFFLNSYPSFYSHSQVLTKHNGYSYSRQSSNLHWTSTLMKGKMHQNYYRKTK